MPTTRTLNRSFAGGELSPEMFGRIDDVKYQTGAAKVRNMIAVPQGPVQNRPGLSFVREVKDSTKKTRLIPFTYSTDQTMVIELGNQYIRFHTQGATLMSGGVPYEIASPYLESDLFDIHYVQSADVLTLVHPSYAPRELRRLGATTWTLTEIAFGATIAAPASVSVAASPGSTINISGVSKANPAVVTMVSAHGLAVGDSVYISGIGGMTQFADGFYIVTVRSTYAISVMNYNGGQEVDSTSWSTYTSGGSVQYGSKTADIDNYYVVTAIASNGMDESVPSSPAHVVNNLNVTGSYNTISWASVAGAVRYNVYKRQSGLYGYIGQTEATSFVDSNIAPDMGITPPIYDLSFVKNGIASVPVTNGGSSYGTAFTGGAFSVINVTNQGSGYTSPTLTVADPTGTGATFTVNLTAGKITSITINTAGSKYTAPIFTLLDSSGSGAVLAPVLTPVVYDAVTLGVTDATGTGASLSPVISNGVITGVTVVSPGSNYTAPTVTVTAAGGGSSATFGTPTLTGVNYPGAVSYFEQRRVFAGSTNSPQQLWMTRSGTESDLSYSLPLKDTDRVSFEVAAREANTIRHVVPLTQLVLLTSAAEWRVSPINSDSITPTTISVRPQSYIGASNVQPSIINNSLVYCAARGGHVRELGYSWQANGFITGDLSLRAAHLFDMYEISDMAYQKSPHPLLWFISSSGKLLGLTYVPEQQIGAWHQHDTDGTFESVTCVAEGEEDHVYVVVKRTINGQTKRYVERMESQQVTTLADCFYVDSGLSYDGTNTTATTVTVSGGSTWGPSDSLTVTASTAIFSYPGTADVDDVIVVTGSDGTEYRLKILSTSSTTVATARVNRTIPTALRNVATAVWAFARNSVSGLSHLEGKTVSILADGAVMPQRVVTSGSISMDRAGTIIHVGLPYDSDLQTLPLALNIDGGGQGRYKNVNKAWLRVVNSSGIFVGPNVDELVEAKQRTTEPYGSPPAMKNDEILVVLTPTWQAAGQIYVRQSDPLPLTIVNMTLEVSIGG